MAHAGASWHDGGLVDGHGVLGVVRHNGVSRLVVGRDLLVLLVYLRTPPLWACGRGKERTREIIGRKGFSGEDLMT